MASYKVNILKVTYLGEADLASGSPLTLRAASETYRRGDNAIAVEWHNYPLYGVYPRLGFKWQPAAQPIVGLYRLYLPDGQPVIDGQPIVPPYFPAQVDNITPVPLAVLERQRSELCGLANTFDIVWWEHFRHCYPEVVENLKRWFRHSISIFGDDCPASAKTKNHHVAKFFDTAIHCNLVFDRNTGIGTKEFYRLHGVDDARYVALGESRGLPDGLAAINFSVEDKIAALARGVFAPIDLVFVGPRAGQERSDLADAAGTFRAAGLNVRLHGLGMPDGMILPREACGGALAATYASAFAGVIPAQYGVAGTRMWDYWSAGMVSFMHDKGGELRMLGARDGEHYVEYDGTAGGLLRAVLAMKANPQRAAEIVAGGLAKGIETKAKYSLATVFEDILFDNLHKWRRA